MLFTYEIVEELLEEVISYALTTFIAQTVSFLVVLCLTQIFKVSTKGLSKALVIAIKPTIKEFIKSIKNKVYNKGVLKMENNTVAVKEKKQNKFLVYLKNNPKTILGIIGAFITCLVSGGSVSLGLIYGQVAIPLWASIVIGAIAFILFAVITIIGVVGSGSESPLQVALRKLAKQMGFGQAVVELDNAMERFNAEEKAKEEREQREKQQRRVAFTQAFTQAVMRGEFYGSLDEYIAKAEMELEEKAKAEELKRAEMRENEIRAEWRQAVLNGCEKSLDEYKKEKNK